MWNPQPCGKTMLADRNHPLGPAMSTDGRTITGIVKDGVIVPQSGCGLPEGMQVNIVIPEDAMTPELKEELAAWQQAGMNSWSMIDEWESKEQ